MASEYTEHFNLDLYTDNDRPNLRDQYNAAIRKIDNKMFDQVTTINLLDSVVDNLKDDVEQMQTDLTNEVTARTNADTALGTRIDNETTARENADTALGTRIDNETTAREGADTTLDNKITAETTARTSADTALGDRIDTVSDGLAAEVTARTNADTAINERIDNLATERGYIGVIGDSFTKRGNGTLKWTTKLNTKYQFIVEAVAGAGFSIGVSFRQQLVNLSENEHFEEMEAIILYGGVNDFTVATAGDMKSLFTNFLNTYNSLSYKPRLIFAFGNIGFARYEGYNRYNEWYSQCMAALHDINMPGIVEEVPYWLWGTTNAFESDNLHPSTTDGDQTIASYMGQLINGTYSGVEFAVFKSVGGGNAYCKFRHGIVSVGTARANVPISNGSYTMVADFSEYCWGYGVESPTALTNGNLQGSIVRFAGGTASAAIMIAFNLVNGRFYTFGVGLDYDHITESVGMVAGA